MQAFFDLIDATPAVYAACLAAILVSSATHRVTGQAFALICAPLIALAAPSHKQIVPPDKEVMRELLELADEDFQVKLIFAAATGVRAGSFTRYAGGTSTFPGAK